MVSFIHCFYARYKHSSPHFQHNGPPFPQGTVVVGRAKNLAEFLICYSLSLGTCFSWLPGFISCSCIYPPLPEKAMAPHSSTLAWKIPWTEEPGRLQSMGSLRVGHDWATSLSLFTSMHWRRKWQPTPVFLPGESQGRGSLVGCRLCGHTELDTTEAT